MHYLLKEKLRETGIMDFGRECPNEQFLSATSAQYIGYISRTRLKKEHCDRNMQKMYRLTNSEPCTAECPTQSRVTSEWAWRQCDIVLGISK